MSFILRNLFQEMNLINLLQEIYSKKYISRNLFQNIYFKKFISRNLFQEIRN